MTSTRSAPASGVWAPIRRTALAKVVVMGVTGVFGLVNTRLIISHFGTDAYAQYGLLATFPNLMPFTDLGIGAVILNSVAGSSDLRHDAIVRRTLTTAIRVLLASALIIATTGVVLGLAGLWPTLLGAKLMDGGGVTATLCLVVYAAALPLSVGQRIVVGMGRSATQVISQGIVSPALTCMLLLAVVVRLEAGNAVSVMSYVANTLVSIVCVVVAWRTTRPLLSQALRDVPRLREVRGVRIVDTAGPSLVQALIIPIAFQTDRLLLSHLGGGQTLAQYNLAAQMFNLLTQTVSVTGMAMWPHFAKARADGRVESPFGAARSFAAMGGGLSLGLVLVAPWMASVLSDGKIELPVTLLAANIANVVVEAAKQPLGMYMTDPRGLRAQMIPVVILVPMNLVLSWVLIAPLGAAGPIAGSVIAVIVCQLVPYALWVSADLRRRRVQEDGDDDGSVDVAGSAGSADGADGADGAGGADCPAYETDGDDPDAAGAAPGEGAAGEAVLEAVGTAADGGGPASAAARAQGRTVVQGAAPAAECRDREAAGTVGPVDPGAPEGRPAASDSSDVEDPDPSVPNQPER